MSWIVILLVTALLLTIAMPAVGAGGDVSDGGGVLYQVSTYSGLLNGSFGGIISAAELKRHGDFGIGAIEGLNGEVIALNGSYYAGRADGKVYPVNDNDTIPFAAVTFFNSSQSIRLCGQHDFSQFAVLMNKSLPSKDLFYAIRIKGVFPYMKFRTIPKQAVPYPTMAEALKNESVFEMHNVSGTLVGIYSPPDSAGIQNAGYHFHFISDDRSSGGHVYDFTVNGAEVELETLPALHMVLDKKSAPACAGNL